MKQNWKMNRLMLLEMIVGVTVAAVVLMALFVLFVPQSRHRTSGKRISSVNHLRQVSFTFLLGPGDYQNKFRTEIPSTNDGAIP